MSVDEGPVHLSILAFRPRCMQTTATSKCVTNLPGQRVFPSVIGLRAEIASPDDANTSAANLQDLRVVFSSALEEQEKQSYGDAVSNRQALRQSGKRILLRHLHPSLQLENCRPSALQSLAPLVLGSQPGEPDPRAANGFTCR